ncbi:MAG: hypothetical protein E6J61_22320 [Deltaproteobacteria bacterium]|nr:MAG: hypothetical protein E6J61_22320 [Deltaproteobacteria bacterium]
MNNVAAVSGPRRLADFLRERRGAILDRWEAAVRQLRPAQRLRRPALLDHIPQFLEELENFVGDLREHRPAAPPEDVPRIHAVERLEMGYELADVVEEYSILRACIIEMAAEERAPAVRSNELPRLHRAIDLAIALSVQRYQQAAAEQRSQLGAELNRERTRADETLADAQRRAAELEAVIESIPDAVYIGDETGMKRINQRALDQLGFDSRDKLARDIPTLVSELQIRDAATGKPMPPEEQVFTKALAGETAVKEVIVRNKKSGEDMVLRSAAAPICLGDQLIGAVAINTDITERIRQERGLREALEVSERLGGVLAHDLRNPLGVISTSASLLQREALEMRHARIVGRISCSAERIDRMIHDLLDYTRGSRRDSERPQRRARHSARGRRHHLRAFPVRPFGGNFAVGRPGPRPLHRPADRARPRRDRRDDQRRRRRDDLLPALAPQAMTHRASGPQAGSKAPCGSSVTCRGLDPSGVIVHSCRFPVRDELKSRSWPFGAHEGFSLVP